MPHSEGQGVFEGLPVNDESKIVFLPEGIPKGGAVPTESFPGSLKHQPRMSTFILFVLLQSLPDAANPVVTKFRYF